MRRHRGERGDDLGLAPAAVGRRAGGETRAAAHLPDGYAVSPPPGGAAPLRRDLRDVLAALFASAAEGPSPDLAAP